MGAMGIAENIKKVKGKIAAVAKGDLAAQSVHLIAVSKKVSAENMLLAVQAGQMDFGENYVQEAKIKIENLRALSPEKPRIHFIGHLQRNKAKEAVLLFDVIHTVDRVELADELNRQAVKIGKIQQVLIQVNISSEATKAGASIEELPSLLSHAITLSNLRVTGLMCIGSYFEETAPDAVRRSEFVRLRELRTGYERSLGILLPDLSMGMSHDFELAVEEGASFVRVGTAIFGAR